MLDRSDCPAVWIYDLIWIIDFIGFHNFDGVDHSRSEYNGRPILEAWGGRLNRLAWVVLKTRVD